MPADSGRGALTSGLVHKARPLGNVDVDLPGVVGACLWRAAAVPAAELPRLRIEDQLPCSTTAPAGAHAVAVLLPLAFAEVGDAEDGMILRPAHERQQGVAWILVHEAHVLLHEGGIGEPQLVGGSRTTLHLHRMDLITLRQVPIEAVMRVHMPPTFLQGLRTHEGHGEPTAAVLEGEPCAALRPCMPIAAAAEAAHVVAVRAVPVLAPILPVSNLVM
mmetsp:Transcript_70589/g.158041  ORF Transcript_70589/g.158041 Transcript_70589/m.158041 type:complete len:218 (+) Transcript_70589:72-725(+)